MKLQIKDYIDAFNEYKKGANITQFLRNRYDINENTPEIIALAYDLQSGVYSRLANLNPKFYEDRATEVCDFIKSTIKTINSIVDVGSGELTMFSRILSRLNFAEKGCCAFASDISLSRLLVGKKSSVNLIPKNIMFKAVVADTEFLPFYTKSIELVITDHSLEPNGGRIEKVVNEVFRVAKNYCVFVEPNNNINSEDGIKRMKSLGYIFDLEETIKNLGGKIIAERVTSHNYNELNKSKMLIVTPPELSRNIKSSKLDSLVNNYGFTYPGTDFNLVEKDGFLFSKECGFVFPIVDGIPILLEENRILASKFGSHDC